MSASSPGDPTRRFSDRVRDYVRYRPDYPEPLGEALRAATGDGDALAADIGSGTGISSGLLLRHGFRVVAVEPNGAMREAAEEMLAGNPGFHSVDGTAEATTLPSGSVDLVTAGQAFHWFRREEARREFARILRGERRVAIFWNSRRVDATPFLRGYEELLHTHAPDYREVDHRRVDAAALQGFFGGEYEYHVFPNQQSFDLPGLRGRLLSSSYAPAPGHPGHVPMLDALERLFAAHREEGTVRFLYDTELYFGRLRA